MGLLIFHLFIGTVAIGLVGANMMELAVAEGPIPTNYCNSSDLLEEAGLIRSTLGQFLGYGCSEEFYHCRWQSDGFRTYRKKCKPGLVYDVLGTQNCNYDYNVKSCGMRSGVPPVQCNGTDFYCSLSEQCVPMALRCDGHYDCAMEEDEQNCPLCTAGEFACKVSEQCIPLDRRCNGLIECDDGTDERDCDVCGHGLFHCSKSNECIPVDERCDGRRQCPHGEDEMLCKKSDIDKKFVCQSRDYEIPANQVCDGRPQCPDGSDEAYCELPKSLGSMSFSNLGTVSPTRPIDSIPEQPEPEEKVEEGNGEDGEEEEDYDYEQIKNENAPSFPMLSLVNLPTTQALKRTTTTPPPTTSPILRTVKPAFSKPRPKINNIYETKTTQKHRIVQPNLVKVTSSSRPVVTTETPIKYPTRSSFESSIRPKTRQPSVIRHSIEKESTEPTPLIKTSQTEKVFVMQVTASPQVAKSNPRGTRRPVVEPSRSTGNGDLLSQITSQINGGMSPELLAKIENIIQSELQTGSTSNRRLTNA